jgi:ubiquinone/menaquinone biosynthesis C-methylase UbiE
LEKDDFAHRSFAQPSFAEGSMTANSAARNCDLIAPWYESLEHYCFGNALEERRFAFLEAFSSARKALLCGEGDGRFLSKLLCANPHVEVNSVDASTNMMRIANRRLNLLDTNARRRTALHCADLAAFVPDEGPFDLIATHFFLDCFSTEQTDELVQRVAQFAAPRALWVISEFNRPKEGLPRMWTRAAIRLLREFFGMATGLHTMALPDYRPALACAGFELQRQEESRGGLLVSELWARMAGCGV